MKIAHRKQKLIPRRKSIRLSSEELTNLKRISRDFHTAVEFCHFFNVTPSTMNRAIHFGSSSPETVAAIRTGIDRYHRDMKYLTA